MFESGPQNPSSGGRRRKRFLSPSQKYEIWLGLLRGESTISEAADRAGVDRSHRKLAHRGSYDQLVWVSPATVRRVLAANGLVLRRPRRAARSERLPFPEWATYERNSIWIYDMTHFKRCPRPR